MSVRSDDDMSSTGGSSFAYSDSDEPSSPRLRILTASAQDLVLVGTESRSSSPPRHDSAASFLAADERALSPHPPRGGSDNLQQQRSSSNSPRAELRSSLFSPTLSSSSRAPSSIQDEGLSDISSLDDDDFELIDAAGGGSVAGISGLADSAHWDDTPRRITPNNVTAAPRAEDRLLEVEALNSSLGSTYDFFRSDASAVREADTSNVSTAMPSAEVSMLTEASTMRGPRRDQSSSLPPPTSDVQSSSATEPMSAGGETQAEPLPTSGSLFHFPDPMDGARKSEADAGIERAAERVEKSTSTVPATGPIEDSKSSSGGDGSVNTLNAGSRFSFLSHGNSSAALRNPWDPAPSSRGNLSSAATDAASRLVSSGDRRRETVDEKLSPEAMAVSSFAGSHPALNAVQAAPIKSEPAERSNTAAVDAAVDAHTHPTPLPLPAQLNVFYMGSRPAKHVFARVVQAIRESLFSAYEACQCTGGEPLFLGDEVRVDLRLASRPAGVTWTRRTSRKGADVELQEFDCTSTLGNADVASGSDVATFLSTFGAAELKCGGALIICFLENGERQQRLPAELAALLRETHDLSKPFWSRAQAPPLLLPILCPRSPSNLDEGDSLSSSSALEADGAAAATDKNDLVRALSRQLDLRAAERTWRAVLSATCASINELSATARITKLAVESAPSQRSDSVLTYEQFLLGGEAEWFGGDATWVARAAFRASPREGTRLVAETEAAPTWLFKTAAWLTSLPHAATTTALATSDAPRAEGSVGFEVLDSRLAVSLASTSTSRDAATVTQTRSAPPVPRGHRRRLRPVSVSGAGAIIIMLAGVLLALMNGRDIRTPGVVLNRPSPMLAGTDLATLLGSLRSSFASSSAKGLDVTAMEQSGTQPSAERSTLRDRAVNVWESFAAAPPRLMAAVESSRSAFLERHQSTAVAPEHAANVEPRAGRQAQAPLLAADKPASKPPAHDGKKPQRATCRDVTLVSQLSKDVAVYQRTRRSKKPSSTSAPASSTHEHLGAAASLPLAAAAVTLGASAGDKEWILRLQAETATLMRDASRGAQQVLGHLVREWSFWVLKLQLFYEQHVLPFYAAQLRPFYTQQVQPRMDAAYRDIHARLRDASATIEHTSGVFLQGIRVARGRLYELDLKKRSEAFGKTMEGAARQARNLGSQAIDHVSSAPRQLKAAQQHVAATREMLDKPRAALRAIERTRRETEQVAGQAAEQITRGARSSIERAVDGARKTKAAMKDAFEELQATTEARRKDAVLKMKALHAAERDAARQQKLQHRKLEHKMSQHLRQKIRESQAQAKAHLQAQVKAGARAAANVKAKAKGHAERKGKGQRGRRQGHTKA